MYSFGCASHASGMGEKNAEVISIMVLHGDVTEPAMKEPEWLFVKQRQLFSMAEEQWANLKGLSGITDKSVAK